MNYNNLFIEPELEINPEQRQRASYLRKEFSVLAGLKSARLIMSACGIYQAFLNGKRLDEQCFLPGFTAYNKRLQVQEYEIADQLQEGRNALCAVVGDGWYRGRIGLRETRNYYGTKTKLLAVLSLTYADGHSEVIHTDESWKATQNGPVGENDLKGGEQYDARLEMDGWTMPGYDDACWQEVKVSSYDGELTASEGEKILEQERFTPTVMHTPDGNTVLDFGQNLSGYLRFRVTGEAGQTVKLTHGETLDEHGNFTLKNLQLEGGQKKLGEAFGQVIRYTLKNGGQEYQPIFTVMGFQYVKVENWPEEVRPENFEAIAVYSDIRVTGSFRCSNPLINRLVENVKWSERSNFLDIPTDCPTRERTGWAGDISIFAETACYLSDPQKFLKKWMEDLKLLQYEDGNVVFNCPDMALGHAFDGSAGWADVIYTIPRDLYRFYGDREIIEETYDNIKRWVEFNVQRAKEKHPDHAKRTEPWWDFILDTGFHFGEWLEPGSVMTEDAVKAAKHPDHEVATAFFADAARSLADMAELLGKKEDEERYRRLFQQIREAYRSCFLPDGRVESDRQCRYVRPLQMGLLTKKEAVQAAADLNDMVIANEYKIGTGFLTTPHILPVLAKYGYLDTAYKLLENTKQPGWLYAVTKGATSIWENWYGRDENNFPRDSMNHFAPGSVAAWLFAGTAGIVPRKPGFEEIGIAPQPGGSLTYAEAEFDTVKGHICSKWKIEEGKFLLDICIPAPAEVKMPDGSRYCVEAGKHSFQCELHDGIQN